MILSIYDERVAEQERLVKAHPGNGIHTYNLACALSLRAQHKGITPIVFTRLRVT